MREKKTQRSPKTDIKYVNRKKIFASYVWNLNCSRFLFSSLTLSFSLTPILCFSCSVTTMHCAYSFVWAFLLLFFWLLFYIHVQFMQARDKCCAVIFNLASNIVDVPTKWCVCVCSSMREPNIIILFVEFNVVVLCFFFYFHCFHRMLAVSFFSYYPLATFRFCCFFRIWMAWLKNDVCSIIQVAICEIDEKKRYFIFFLVFCLNE